MPHKKVKKSARDEEHRSKVNDQNPGAFKLESEPIPKSIARVLNASSLRNDYKKRKRDQISGEDGASQPASKKKRKGEGKDDNMRLLPGESLSSFNRRVEENMRNQIRTAVQNGQANARRHAVTEREERAQKKLSKDNEPEATSSKAAKNVTRAPDVPSPPALRAAKGKTEFETLSSRAPKRLNDIAEAPPDLSALVKKTAFKGSRGKDGEVFGKDIVSPEQKRMMEIEREKAIRRYRELKEKRMAKAS